MIKTKKVNIYPRDVINSVTPPVRVTIKNTTKTIDYIRKCIIARAYVEEVLEDGTLLPLDFSNYDKDNNKHVVKESVEPVEEVHVDEKQNIKQEEINHTDDAEKAPNTHVYEQNRNNNKKKNKHKNNYQQHVTKEVKDEVKTVVEEENAE